MKCHVDHTVFELFEKRHFRCDCGVPRSGCSCVLDPCAPMEGRKLLDNEENRYNHNFDGLYCWCNKPYDHSSDVTMYMCVICQDWYHEQCIKDMEGAIPAEEDFDDFFCKDCVAKHPFLLHYYSKFTAFPEGLITTPTSADGSSSSSTVQSAPSEISPGVGSKRKRDELESSERETREEQSSEICKCAGIVPYP